MCQCEERVLYCCTVALECRSACAKGSLLLASKLRFVFKKDSRDTFKQQYRKKKRSILTARFFRVCGITVYIASMLYAVYAMCADSEYRDTFLAE